RDPLPRIESAWLHLRHFTTDDPFERVGVRGTPESLRVDVDFNRAVRRRAERARASQDLWAGPPAVSRPVPRRAAARAPVRGPGRAPARRAAALLPLPPRGSGRRAARRGGARDPRRAALAAARRAVAAVGLAAAA